MAFVDGRNTIVRFAATTLPANEAAWDAISQCDGVQSATFSGSAGEIDVTHQGSTAREYIAGLKDAEVSFEILWSAGDTEQEKVRDAFDNSTDLFVAIDIGGAAAGDTRIAGQFVITSLEFNNGIEEAIVMSVSGRLSGYTFSEQT